MKVLKKLALIACRSAIVGALPTPDGSHGNLMIARSEDVAAGAAAGRRPVRVEVACRRCCRW